MQWGLRVEQRCYCKQVRARAGVHHHAEARPEVRCHVALELLNALAHCEAPTLDDSSDCFVFRVVPGGTSERVFHVVVEPPVDSVTTSMLPVLAGASRAFTASLL